jgi:hypothetical protein
MVFVRSSWDPIKFLSALKKLLFCGLSSFLIFKNFSRRTIKAQNVGIDEGNDKESVSLPNQNMPPMITYSILKSNRSRHGAGQRLTLTEAGGSLKGGSLEGGSQEGGSLDGGPAALTRRTRRRTLSRRRGGCVMVVPARVPAAV